MDQLVGGGREPGHPARSVGAALLDGGDCCGPLLAGERAEHQVDQCFGDSSALVVHWAPASSKTSRSFMSPRRILVLAVPRGIPRALLTSAAL